MPWYLDAHGVVLTGWFTLLVVRAILVAARRTDLHRLGIAGAVPAIALVAISLLTVLRVPHRFATGQLPIPFEFASGVLINDGALAFFSTMVATAMALRRRPEAHRRPIILASYAIIGPAWSRVGTFVLPARYPALAFPFDFLFKLGLPPSLGCV